MSKSETIQVVGITTPQIIFVSSNVRKFRTNEILTIEDADLNFPKGEVIETQSFNKYIPLSNNHSGMFDDSVIESLKHIGHNLDEDEINIAKVRLSVECPFPIKTGSKVRLPYFDEVEKLLVKKKPNEGLTLGILKGTEEISQTMPYYLQNVAHTFDAELNQIKQQNAVPFIFDFKKMSQYPHLGIFGGSGSGKSYGLRVFLEELAKKRIPTLCFDPHFELTLDTKFKGLPAEYEEDFSKSVVKLTAGEDVGINFHELSTNEVITVLSSIGKLSDPMMDTIKTLHKRKDSLYEFSNKINNLIFALENTDYILSVNLEHNKELKEEEKQKIQNAKDLYNKYSNTIKSVLTLSAIARKIKRLKSEGIFVSNVDKIKEGLLSRKIVVVRGSLWILQIMSGFIMQKMYRLRRAYCDSIQRPGNEIVEKFVPFFILSDEAHNFAHKTEYTPSKPVLREIAQEGRKYGVFLIPATQRPSLLDDTITAQLNTKFVFRTVRGSDISLIKEETDISPEEAKRLPYLQSGDCFVSSAIIGRTLFTRIRVAKTVSPHTLDPFDELNNMFLDKNRKIFMIVSKFCPISDTDLFQKLRLINSETEQNIGIDEMKDILENLTIENLLKKQEFPFGGFTYDVNPT